MVLETALIQVSLIKTASGSGIPDTSALKLSFYIYFASNYDSVSNTILFKVNPGFK